MLAHNLHRLKPIAWVLLVILSTATGCSGDKNTPPSETVEQSSSGDSLEISSSTGGNTGGNTGDNTGDNVGGNTGVVPQHQLDAVNQAKTIQATLMQADEERRKQLESM